MDRPVYVAGCGLTSFGERWEASATDLAAEACAAAIADAGLAPDAIEAAWLGAYYPTTASGGSFLVDATGLEGLAVTRVENLCATGSDAFRQACLAVGGGAVDIALVCGVEKLTDDGARGLPREPQPSALADLVDVNLFALLASSCFDRYGWTRDDLAAVAIKNLGNGSHHPKAHLRGAPGLDSILASPFVSSPLAVQDCCAISDGSAALVIASEDVARGGPWAASPVRVVGLAAAAGVTYPWFDEGFELDGFEVTRRAAAAAYAQAGIVDPARELDLVEVHDCFTIAELLDIGDIGLCEPGAAAEFVGSGAGDIGGEVAVNPSGGLKSFGHPIGATGVRMVQEVVRQLQVRAEGRQVPGAIRGMVQNLGGLGGICLTAILEGERR